MPSSAGGYPSSIAPKVQADVSLADAPPLDVIMVPGGFGTVQQLQNQTLLAWLRERAPKARFTTSVCSGSAILAKAGLLDDKRATSNKQLFSFIAAQGPEVEWVKSARWVEDGAIITSSGVSAGIDMALALIAKLFGIETAEAIANATSTSGTAMRTRTRSRSTSTGGCPVWRRPSRSPSGALAATARSARIPACRQARSP